jgi:hypothetical protein
MTTQAERLYASAEHYFPAVVAKHGGIIRRMLNASDTSGVLSAGSQNNDFSRMFKILTLIDSFSLASNISAMFTIEKAFTDGTVDLASQARPLLASIITMSSQLLNTLLDAAAAGTLPATFEWPNLTIIRKVFASYVMKTPPVQPKLPKATAAVTGVSVQSTASSAKDDADDARIRICDVFNGNNSVKYDISDYDNWGPLLNINRETEMTREYGLPADEGLNEWLRIRKIDESEELAAIDEENRRRSGVALDYLDWMIS